MCAHRSLFPLLLCLVVACAGGDEGNNPSYGDGGAPPPPGQGNNPSKADEVPSGCEGQCVTEGKHLCVSDPNSTTNKCVACLNDSHCAANPWAFGPTCSDTGNKCKCDSDAECASSKRGTKCKTSYGRCYCETDADCAAPLRCVDKYLSTGVCGMPCASSADCPDPDKPNCDTASGKCVGCAAANDCQVSPNGTLCDSSKCTCKADVDCQGDYPWGSKCITSSKRCGCDTDAECGGNAHGPKCHTTFHKCTCDSDAECTTAPYSKCARPYRGASYKHCQEPCASNADCVGKNGLKTCDAAKGICVACMQDADCTSKYSPYCSPQLGKCISCKQDSDCTSRTKPFCDDSQGKCVECKANPDCADNMDGKLCDKGNCKCATDADCDGGYPWGTKCIAKYNRCGCDADADCGGNAHGPKCYTTYSKCTCAGDAGCTKAPYTKCAAPYSSATYDHCQKPCAVDADCVGLSGMKICDAGSGKCVACMTDSDCTSSYYKYCMASKGKCVRCRSDADCTSTSYKFCEAASGKCIQCRSDADCPAGKTCYTSSYGSRYCKTST